MGKIRIISMGMGERPVVTEMDTGLSAMQEKVGGLITCVQVDGDYESGVDLWCNDEGLYTFGPNRHVQVGRFSQVIHGPMFLAAHDEEGETVGLTDEQIAKWLPLCKEWPMAMTSLPEDFEPQPGEQLLIQ